MGLDTLGIQYNAAEGMIGLPLWAAAIAAGLLLVFFVLALVRTGLAGTLMFLALVGFGGWAAWSWTDYARAGEKRALEARLQAIETQAQASGALACLDAAAGDPMTAACERAVFASADSAAAASAYVNSQVRFLADARRYTEQDADFVKVSDPVRLSLEQDRFGVVAHTLVQRRGCTVDKCDAFATLKDTARIRANMRDNTFASHIGKAAAHWQERQDRVASATPSPPANATPGAAAPGQPLPPGYNLPSAASIPPVSIMQPEPTTAPPPAATPPRVTSPPRRPPPQAQPPRRPTPEPRQSEARPPDNGLLPPPPRPQ